MLALAVALGGCATKGDLEEVQAREKAIAAKGDQAAQDAQAAKVAADEAMLKANEAVARAEEAERRAIEREKIAAERERVAEEKAKKAEVEAVEVPTEETPQVEAPVVSEAQANPEKFLKDFNWHNYEEGIDQVDDKQLKEFEKLVSENFVDTLDDEVVI